MLKKLNVLLIASLAIGFMMTVSLAQAASPPTPTQTPRSTPTAPSWSQPTDDLSGDGIIHGLVVRGAYAYVAAGQAGLRILNLADPDRPLLVGQLDTAGYTLGLAVDEDYAYLADELHGLRVIDIAQPTNPLEVGFYDTPGVVDQLAVAAGYAYLLGDGFLRIVDLHEPHQPHEIGLYEAADWPEQLVVGDGYVYLLNQGQGIQIVDLSDPSQPQAVGHYPLAQPVQQMALVDSTLYLMMEDTSLSVVDVSAAEHPVAATTCVQEHCSCVGYQWLRVYRGMLSAHRCSETTPQILVESRHLDWLIKQLHLEVTLRGGYRILNEEALFYLLPGLPSDLVQTLVAAGDFPLPTPTTIRQPRPSPTPTVSPSVRAITLSRAGRPTPPPHAHNLEIVAHYGGAVSATATDGQYLYTNFGPELAVMAVSQPLTSTRLGHLLLPHPIEQLYVDDGYAYLSDSEDMLWIVDLAEPATPRQVAWLDTRIDGIESTGINDITKQGPYLYLATQYRDLLVVDVSDPTQPFEVAQIFGGGLGTVDEIVTQGEYAWLWPQFGDTVDVLNLADPTQAQWVASIDKGYERHAHEKKSHLALMDGRLYLYRGAQSGVYDISIPAKPLELESVPTQPEWYGPTVGGHRYQASPTGQLQITALDSVESVLYPSWSTTNAQTVLSGAWGNQLYLTINGNQQVRFETTPASLPMLTAVQTDSLTTTTPFATVQHGSYLYHAAGVQGLHLVALDAQPMSQPPLITGLAVDVALEPPYLYVAQGKAGVAIFDVTDPTQPLKVAQYQPPDLWVSQLTVAQHRLYLSGYVDGATPHQRYQLQIVEVTTPQQPSLLSSYDLPHWIWDVQVADTRLYLVDSRGLFHIFDLATSGQLVELGAAYLPNQAYQLALSDATQPQYAYIAAGVDGLRVLDISTPISPTEVAFYDTPGNLRQVGVSETGLIYGSDDTAGVYSFRLQTPLSESPPKPPMLTATATLSLPLSPLSPYELVDLPQDDPVRQAYLLQQALFSPDDLTYLDYSDVKLIPIKQHGPDLPDVLLVFTPSHHGGLHYLFYKHRPDNRWAVWGQVQYTALYGESGYRFVSSPSGDVWLVTRHFAGGGGGTGSAFFEERWYWLNQPQPKLVLRIPSSGLTNIGQSAYATYFSSTVEVASVDWSHDFALDVHFSTDYPTLYDRVLDDQRLTIVTQTGTLRYIWLPNQAQFTYLPEQSTLSVYQMNSLGITHFFYDGNPDRMLQNNFTALLERWLSSDLAFYHWATVYFKLQPKPADALWMKIYPKKSSNSPEKRMLTAIMRDTM